jgi:hypothetical protein
MTAWRAGGPFVSDRSDGQERKISRRTEPRAGEMSGGWSGRRESNPRHSAWEADVLPLNYGRKINGLLVFLWAMCLRIVSR